MKKNSGLSQVLENQGDLTGSEHVLRGAVLRLAERFGELLVSLDPGGQAVKRCTLTDVGSIGLCQFVFVIRTDAVFHVSDEL